MKIRNLAVLLLLISAAGCDRKREPNKLIDGIPVNVTATVLPAQATQQFLLLQRDLMTVLIPVINKFAFADSTYPELIDAGGGNYTFWAAEQHYGRADFTISFRDGASAPTDPILVNASSATFKSAVISITGSSALFTFTQNATLTLETEGKVDSRKLLLGSAIFTGIGAAAGESLTFTVVGPGATAIFQGLSDGRVSATGSGGTPAAPIAIDFSFTTNRNINGTLAWEGQEGTFHIDETGTGYIVTSQERILLD